MLDWERAGSDLRRRYLRYSVRWWSKAFCGVERKRALDSDGLKCKADWVLYIPSGRLEWSNWPYWVFLRWSYSWRFERWAILLVKYDSHFAIQTFYNFVLRCDPSGFYWERSQIIVYDRNYGFRYWDSFQYHFWYRCHESRTGIRVVGTRLASLLSRGFVRAADTYDRSVRAGNLEKDDRD